MVTDYRQARGGNNRLVFFSPAGHRVTARPFNPRSIPTKSGYGVGIACAIGSVLLFASFALVSRFGLTSQFAAIDLASFRFGIGAAILLPLFLRFGLAGLSLPRAVALACSGGVGFAVLAYSGFRLAPSSHAAVLLHGTLPLFGALCGALLLGQTFDRLRIVALALIACGVVAIAAAEPRADARVETLLGDGFLLAAAACWSLFGALLARWRVDAKAAAGIVAALSLVIFGPYVLVSGHTVHAAPSLDFALQAVLQGVLVGAVSLFLYSHAVRALGATTMALVSATVPLLTILGAVPLLNEWPGTLEWAGVAFVIAGMIAIVLPMNTKGRS
jgi:drug/metabolite transporter (DMT)-like permease